MQPFSAPLLVALQEGPRQVQGLSVSFSGTSAGGEALLHFTTEEMEPREVKGLLQGHTASRWTRGGRPDSAAPGGLCQCQVPVLTGSRLVGLGLGGSILCQGDLLFLPGPPLSEILNIQALSWERIWGCGCLTQRIPIQRIHRGDVLPARRVVDRAAVAPPTRPWVRSAQRGAWTLPPALAPTLPDWGL